MKNLRCFKILITFLCIAIFFLEQFPALAQGIPNIPTPPTRSSVDDNGVDLATGKLQLSSADLSIGPIGSGGLTHVRIWTDGGWRHGFETSLSGAGNDVTITMAGQSSKFTKNGSTFTSNQANGETLVISGSDYIYTKSDGTEIFLTNPGFATMRWYNGLIGALAYKVRSPSGEIFLLTYKQSVLVNQNFLGGVPVAYFRIQSVTSNAGYQLKYEYFNDNSTSGDIGQWLALKRVVAINNSVEYCDPSADSCSGLAYAWPSVSYDSATSGSNVLQSVSDALGRVSRYTSDAANRIIGIKRPSSSVDNVVIAYDANKRVSSVSNGSVNWTYVWSVSGSTLTAIITDPLSHQRVTTANTALGVLLSEKDALNHTTSYQYDGAGRKTRVTAPEGNYVQYVYDARGNLTTTTTVSKTAGTPADISVSASYDAVCSNPKTCNKPNTTTDARGSVTNYSYDGTHGGVLTVTAPADVSGTRPQTRYSYTALSAYYKNSSGAIVAASSPIYKLTAVSSCASGAFCIGTASEVKATISYGASGVANNLLPTTSSLGSGDGTLTATSTAAYDLVGNRVTVDGPLPGAADTTKFFYDAGRQVTMVVGPDPDGGGVLKNRATQTTYNLDGQVTASSQGNANADGTGFVSMRQNATSFDNLARKVATSFSSGGTTYAVTQFSYDIANRLECTAQRMNPAQFGSLPAACAPGTAGSFGADRITKNGYDVADRLTSVITGYGSSVQRVDQAMSYNNNDDLVTLADGKNNLTTYEYDGFGRLSKTRFPSPTAAGTSSISDYEELTYNNASNVTARRLRDGQTIGFTYDNLGRVIVKTLDALFTPESNVVYTYNLLGRVSSTSQGATTISFGYDALGRLLSETEPFGSTASQYDLAGRRTRLTWNDGFYVDYDYLITGEMVAVRENGAPSGPGVLATYGYDDLGQRTTLTRGNGTSTSYSYDPVSRLSSLTQDLAGTIADQTQSFSAYNPAGQIMSQTRSNDAYAWTETVNVNRSYASNGLSQYTLSGTISPSYDARGNLTSAGGTTYSFTAENLVKGATGATNASLYYDPLGRMVQYDAYASTRFLYDGANMISEIGNPSGGILRRYVHGPAADEPLVWYEGAGIADRRWLHADERGSITAISDVSGNMLVINRYDEFGIPQSTNVGRFQFTGQAWLPELGLYYYKARIYSPTFGRFLQADPLGYGDGMNMYAYVRNDPVNSTDPSGTQTQCGTEANGTLYCTTTVTGTRPSDSGGSSVNLIGLIKPAAKAVGNAVAKVAKKIFCGIFGCKKKVDEVQYTVQDQCNGGALRDSVGDIVNSPISDPLGAITSDSSFRILVPGAQFAGLSNFGQGEKFDFQRYGTDGKHINFDWKSISTIGIGYYASINNISYESVMAIQNRYAGAFSNFGNVAMDKDYPNLPASNVGNTKIGYTQALCGRGRF